MIALTGANRSGAAVGTTTVACGDVVTTSIVLANDVGPCLGDGIVIGADGVKIDLNGHVVSGTPLPGEGAGVLVNQRTGVHVTNGEVTGFDGGVVILGGSANKVTKVTASANIGLARRSLYGDGIAVLSSTGNLVKDNVVRGNGPFAGIGLYQEVDADHPRTVTGPTSGNTINGNHVIGNDAPRSLINDNDGIRLEPKVSGNTVVNNVVRGSGLDGIALFRGSASNVVEHNVVEHNGFHKATHRKGDGIRVFPGADATLVRSNRVFSNAANGIIVQSTSNQILSNRTGSNNLAPGTMAAYDLHDFTPGCADNVWLGNSYGTGNQDCVKG